MSEALKVAVGVDARWDVATIAMCKYRNEHVYPFLREKGFEVSQVQAVHDRAPVVAAITRRIDRPGLRDDFITGSGHGTATTFRGWGNETIFDISPGKLPTEVKVVHLFACSTAAQLGSKLAEDGRAFFGYSQEINIGIGEEDALDAVLECDSMVDLLLAEGKSAGEVRNEVLSAFDERIDAFDAEGKVSDAGTVRRVRQAFQMHGNDDIRLFDRPAEDAV